MIFYKILDDEGNVCAKGSTCDGVELLSGQEEITKEEYDSIEFPQNEIQEPSEEPLTVEQQLILTQLQQQQTIDALIVAQLGGVENV